MTLSIGVDVGGTKVAAGVVNEQGEILQRVRRPTPRQDSDAFIATIAACVNDLKSSGATTVGIGQAGYIAADRDTLIYGTNVPLQNGRLGSRIAELTGMPVVVENDANAAAWAEYRFGAAADAESAVVVTLGTGLGGGVIMNGNLLRGAFGFGAEIGHIHMVPNGPLCGCGSRGCWEVMGSGSALVRFATERAANYPSGAARILELGEGRVTGPAVTAAAQEGDEMALDVFNEFAHWNAIGLADMATIFDPEIFVIAGGVSEAGSLVLDPLVREFPEVLAVAKYRTLPEIRLARLGNDAGIIGAADLSTIE